MGHELSHHHEFFWRGVSLYSIGAIADYLNIARDVPK